MSRWRWGPIHWSVTFVLMALVVIAGLAGVTITALRVELAQLHSTARADHVTRERLALWRLDSHLLPAFGIENNRPYSHYWALTAPFPAVDTDQDTLVTGSVRIPSPLLSADLPAWMVLHFQIDPERGWTSPQVITPELEERLTAPPLELRLPNVTAERAQWLDRLRTTLPSPGVIAQLSDSEAETTVSQPIPSEDETAWAKPSDGRGAVIMRSPPKDPGVSTERPGLGLGMAGATRLPPGVMPGRILGYAPSQQQAAIAPNNDRFSANSQLSNYAKIPGPQVANAEQTPEEREFNARSRAAQKSQEYRGGIENAQNGPRFGQGGEQARVIPPIAEDAAGKKGSEGQLPLLPSNYNEKGVPQMPGIQNIGIPQNIDAIRPAIRKSPPMPHPGSVHLGSFRTRWLTAKDGSQILVLARAVQLGHKTVYQGLVIDWSLLRAELEQQVTDLFPTGHLNPVTGPGEFAPERAMTALPVQLDPGEPPASASAGWTPLRVGLLMAWTTALLALGAVTAAGRALVGLSERRIRFVSAVTHELRTPLTSLRLYLDLLSSGLIEDPDKQKEYLATLTSESDRLNRLIENVLDFARLEKQSVRAILQPTAVNAILDEVQQTWGDRCRTDGRELILHSTWPIDQPILTDSRMVNQVLGNLIDNSRKYARESTDPRIWVWAKPGSANTITFEVEDRGPGIPASDRRSIFQAFRRGEHADTQAGGAGLGLALARHWVELLGGELDYRPANGGTGACFRITLPNPKNESP